MGLFSKPKTATARAGAPRAAKPRVFLSREDRKQLYTPRHPERLVGYAVAAYTLLASIALTSFLNGGISKNLPVLLLQIGLCILAGVAAWKGGRIMLGAATIAMFAFVQWGKNVAFAMPLLAFVVWIQFRTLRDQKELIAARVASGDYGRAREKASTSTVTTDSTGRTIAPKSKRYTPPKKTKKR